MAHVRMTKHVSTTHIYNIDEPVGPGCANRKLDVMLVQHLLATVFNRTAELSAPNNELLKVDGIAGPQTFKFIKAYQDQRDLKSMSVLKHDGIVHPATTRAQAPGSGVFFTLVFLNEDYQRANPTGYKSIANDPNAPEALQRALCLFG